MNRPTFSPFQIRRTAFREVSLAAVEEGTLEGAASFSQELTCALADEEEHLWRVELKIAITHDPKKPFAYTGCVHAVGIVEVDPSFPKDKVAEAVQVNGGSMLYSTIREMVAMVTSRSTKGTLLLPTLNFRSVVQNHSEPTATPAGKPEAKRGRKRRIAAGN